MQHRSAVRALRATSHVGAILALSLLLALATGCGDGNGSDAGGTDAGPVDTDSGPFMPDEVCPGGPDCPDTGDGVLYVGAASRDINPDWVYDTWTDSELDGEFEETVDPWVDVDGDGEFDGIWIAGYGNARAANGVMDDIFARTVVLRHNSTTIAITALDCVGYFFNAIEEIRADLPASLGVDLVIVAATHVHEAPDTMGIWGPDLLTTGTDPRMMENIHDAVVANITDAVAALEPADVTYARTVTEHPTRSFEPYVSDSRDPTILDATLTLMQFTRESDGSTIGSIINWSAHPEYLGSENLMISSDISGVIRDLVTNGIDDAWSPMEGGPIPGIGGTTLFINGPIGGMIGPNRVVAITPDESMEFSSASIDKMSYAGRGVAKMALEALANGALTEDSAPLEYRTKRIDITVRNVGFYLYALYGVIVREIFNYTPGIPVDQGNPPYLESEVAWLRIGSAEIITAPGELFPEFWVGGYDGSLAGPWPIIEPGQANPPPLDKAPPPPYLKDLMTGEYRMCWGLTQDEIGYILPVYNFVLHPQSEYIEEADGDHYEETNSVGPEAEVEVVGTMRDLLTWTPDGG